MTKRKRSSEILGDRQSFLGEMEKFFRKMPKKGHSAKNVWIRQKFGLPVSEVLDPLVPRTGGASSVCIVFSGINNKGLSGINKRLCINLKKIQIMQLLFFSSNEHMLQGVGSKICVRLRQRVGIIVCQKYCNILYGQCLIIKIIQLHKYSLLMINKFLSLPLSLQRRPAALRLISCSPWPEKGWTALYPL